MRKHALPVLVMAALAALTSGCKSTSATGEKQPPLEPTDVARQLNELSVRTEGSISGYNRDQFPHWSTISGQCDTREQVLQRDAEPGSAKVEPSTCRVTAGTWISPYDGATQTKATDVDIDHMVPLAEAWRSGANDWTKDQREALANDMQRPQLFVVIDEVNQAKGDKDPARWRPSQRSYWCAYVSQWVAVKHHYRLSVDSAEKAALQDMLRSCE